MLDVDVRARFGEFMLDARFQGKSGVSALFGRSGAGKSSLINILAGLKTPDAGRIAIGDRVLFDAHANINVAPNKRRIGYVFQDSLLFPHMNVRANLTYGMKLVSVAERYQSFDDVVDLLGLSSLLARRPAHLSGGERQRVAIGRAILSSPHMLLMDEPLASLDAGRKSEILPLIERMARELSIPIVYVSHILDEVVRLADTLVLLSDGKTIASGPVEDLMARLDLHPFTGRYEAGAVLNVRVHAHIPDDQLTALCFGHGEQSARLFVPQMDVPTGTRLRVRVRARDVALALEAPARTSILNQFVGVVREISQSDGPQVDVLLNIEDGSEQGSALIARVTKRSARDLGLTPGLRVYAMAKAIAIDRHAMGGVGGGIGGGIGGGAG